MQTNPYPPPNPYQPSMQATATDPTAVMGRRIGAWLLDGVLWVVVGIVSFAAMMEKFELLSSEAASNACEFVNSSPDGGVCLNIGSTIYGGSNGDFSLVWLVMLAFVTIFHVVMPSLTGFSPGKGIVGLRIVNKETFQHAGFGGNIVRALLWVVDGIPFCAPLVGFITGLASKGHRRVGDMAGSTLVVHKDSVGRPVHIAGVNSAIAGAASGEAAPPPTSWSPPPPVAPVSPPAAPPSFPAPSPAAPDLVAAPPPPTSNWTPPVADTSEPPVVEDFPAPAEPEVFEPVGAEADDDATDESSSDEPVVEDPPTADPAPEPASEPTADAAPGTEAPQWDEARNTYIQWDPDLQAWMEWSEQTGRWIPIST